ncbi:hypothetical protein [Nocardioides sp. CER19]|uniref:hypothetical protein n=1 Tax=Nocardioides sp. CER19 TaxID=3038538 RepID=UPI00244C0305|nr:hypothetical protein [Nocardioides sp. CER19]MDH2415809.1 hypothetical protein [Nocardioides sp. CER19]
MGWEVSPPLAAELGDNGPWVWHLKDAWHACTTDAREVHRPRKPALGVADWHGRFIAYWTPMFQPLLFGLGWTRPDVGLARWRDMGYPALDPILNAALRWWGKSGIEDLLAWAAITDVFIKQAEVFGEQVGMGLTQQGRLPDAPAWEARRHERPWKDTWKGGGDPFHLWHHAVLPLGLDWSPGKGAHLGQLAAAPKVYDVRVGSQQGSVLLADTYPGWYLRLAQKPPITDSGVVDVVRKPVGWLGAFRRSPDTKLWHRTAHDLHLLGQGHGQYAPEA